MTPTTTSALRRRTVLSMAGTGALGALAGCLSAFSSDGADADESEPETETDGDEAPLTDYEYTEPPQIVDLAEQDYRSTLRTVSARHQLVTDEATGAPSSFRKYGPGRPTTARPAFRARSTACGRARRSNSRSRTITPVRTPSTSTRSASPGKTTARP